MLCGGVEIVEDCLHHAGVHEQAFDPVAAPGAALVRRTAVDQKPVAVNRDRGVLYCTGMWPREKRSRTRFQPRAPGHSHADQFIQHDGYSGAPRRQCNVVIEVRRVANRRHPRARRRYQTRSSSGGQAAGKPEMACSRFLARPEL
jgi:hypothetical protein